MLFVFVLRGGEPGCVVGGFCLMMMRCVSSSSLFRFGVKQKEVRRWSGEKEHRILVCLNHMRITVMHLVVVVAAEWSVGEGFWIMVPHPQIYPLLLLEGVSTLDS